MKLRGQSNPISLIKPESAAIFALVILVAATALVGFLLSNKRSYQPSPGLVCPNNGPVDFSAFAAPGRRWKPRDPEDLAGLEEVRANLAKQPHADVAGIRIWVEVALVPGQSEMEAVKSNDGRWTLTMNRRGDFWRGQKSHAQIELSKAQSDELERVLGNPCLYAEPEIIGNDYPSANGKPGYCFDGANTFVDLYFSGRRRTAVQACETYGLTGQLVDLLREPLKESGA